VYELARFTASTAFDVERVLQHDHCSHLVYHGTL